MGDRWRIVLGWGLQERLNFKIKLKILPTGGLSFTGEESNSNVFVVFFYWFYDDSVIDGRLQTSRNVTYLGFV